MIGYRQQIADYTRICLQLVWQRQAMLTGGFLMAAFFFDLQVALFCYCVCQMAEWYDIRVCREAREWYERGGHHPASYIGKMTRSAALSSGSMAVSIVLLSIAEGPGLHLGQLSFLFSAALYSAMNHCQTDNLLRVRLQIYRIAFLFIPLWDLVLTKPPLQSQLWMQLVTVIFMLFMLGECSRSFRKGYLSLRSRLADLRDERDKVAQALELQSRFVSIVSHELRTPLTSIKASLDLICEPGLNMSEEAIRNAATIGQRNAGRLATLINDLLDFQKLTANKMIFRIEMLDLNDLVQDTIEANRALGADRRVSVSLNTAPAPVWVQGDTDRLHQVVLNVLSNAVKFSEEQGVVQVAVEASGGVARIRITDTGIGIPPEAHDRVFAPFVQVDVSDKRAASGTGLGMSISRSIMEGLGGSIDFESRVGEGTTFVMELDEMTPEDRLEAVAPARDALNIHALSARA